MLLRGCSVDTARGIVRRIRRRERREMVDGYPVEVRLSLGVAPVASAGIDAAAATADERMYVNKRRRKQVAAAA